MNLKRVVLGPVALLIVSAIASYFHSWWLVFCGFVFLLLNAVLEFADVKNRLTRIETKLDIPVDTDVYVAFKNHLSFVGLAGSG